MKRQVATILLLALALGCSNIPGGPLSDAHSEGGGDVPLFAAEVPADGVVARVNGRPITMAELQKPLIEGYGLKVLLFQVQLTLARQKAAEQKVAVTPADVEAELDRTLKAAFKGADVTKEDYPTLLQQLLDNRGISRPEFDMVIQTNSILRKIAERDLKGAISEDNVKEAFNAMYGSTAVIRHIQCANPQEAVLIKTRLASDEKFEDLARAMSRNARTAPLGGELPPFSRDTVNWGPGLGKIPQAFKDWAFSAKAGEISDAVFGDGAFHILKLEKKLEPKIVKFDDVKENIRKQLEETLLEKGIAELRKQLGAMARKAMLIEEPTLRRQFELRLAQQEKAIHDEQKIREELRERAATQPTTLPVTRPQTNPSGTLPPADSGKASPANAPTGERPPATKSAGSPVDGRK